MLVQQYSVHLETKRTTLQSTDCWLQQFTLNILLFIFCRCKPKPAASISWLNWRARFLLS
uniref:Candidate secreted effector n=1 Tax=Meloidogyne incognita TaxID=6306 RepID=A0A914L1X8_MELIC